MTLLSLNGCSSSFDIRAFKHEGRVAFVAEEVGFWGQPACIRTVTVETDDARAKPADGDDTQLVAHGVFWWQSLRHGECQNKFPITYGVPLRGEPLVYETNAVPAAMRGQRVRWVSPKQLVRDVKYTINVTSGSTAYGCGRFLISKDGQVHSSKC